MDGYYENCRKCGIVTKIREIIKTYNKLPVSQCRTKREKKYIAVNMSANILGMGNAATPMGIKAMQCLDKENTNPLYTSKKICVCLSILNTTSVQLIPTTIIALRVAAGSANPFSVILPIWISSFTAAFIALTLTKLLYRE